MWDPWMQVHVCKKMHLVLHKAQPCLVGHTQVLPKSQEYQWTVLCLWCQWITHQIWVKKCLRSEKSQGHIGVYIKFSATSYQYLLYGRIWAYILEEDKVDVWLRQLLGNGELVMSWERKLWTFSLALESSRGWSNGSLLWVCEHASPSSTIKTMCLSGDVSVFISKEKMTITLLS